jgi:uncharacterized repeat protein (TIGR01451 family)
MLAGMAAVEEDNFEQPIVEIERRIEELSGFEDAGKRREIERLRGRLDQLRREIYAKLTPWQKTLVARHPRRPYTLDLVGLLFEDFVEVRGDRTFGDDPAIVAGFGLFHGRPVAMIGHQKGRDTKEKIYRNFGMPRPEGYRKALRVMKMAEKFHRPILCFVDTPGAYPGLDAEERGQGEAIARNLREMVTIRVPIVVTVTAPPLGGSITNLASVTHVGPDPVAGNNSASETTTVTQGPTADLSVAKSDGGAPVLWGQPFTWTITVGYAGPNPTTDASVTDVFPAGVTGVGWTCTASVGSSCPAGGTGDIAAAVSLLVGGTATFTATGTVVVGTASLTNTATIAPPAGVYDPSPANNSASVTAASGPYGFYPLVPCRVVDTRISGPALAANSTRSFSVAGLCQVPADAQAVVAILIAVIPGDLGDLRLYPTGLPAPQSSTINFRMGRTRANNVTLPLGAGGQINVQCDMPVGSTRSTHFVLDVVGYFR